MRLSYNWPPRSDAYFVFSPGNRSCIHAVMAQGTMSKQRGLATMRTTSLRFNLHGWNQLKTA
ncbi:hypothetical protein [Thiolapillus sp.]|uniref:hypothetical protein n=1 Tax=Thiolapillus sp. TaxID=2017437 RepID=UPI003AF50900